VLEHLARQHEVVAVVGERERVLVACFVRHAGAAGEVDRVPRSTRAAEGAFDQLLVGAVRCIRADLEHAQIPGEQGQRVAREHPLAVVVHAAPKCALLIGTARCAP
jgi:hypothetical protein